jgi:hypothetical protein
METVTIYSIIGILLQLVIIAMIKLVLKSNKSELERDLKNIVLVEEITKITKADLEVDESQSNSLKHIRELLNQVSEKENPEFNTLKNEVRDTIINEYKNSDDFVNLLKYERTKSEKTGIDKFKKSNEMKLLLKEDYNAGKEEGRNSAFNELHIELSPYKEHEEGFFSDSTLFGIQYQLFLKGIPILEPSIQILGYEKKVNTERIREINKILTEAVTATANALLGANIKAIKKK